VTPRQLEWVAGFLEGEGYFSWYRTAWVSATQVQIEPLVRLQRLFGGWLSKHTQHKHVNIWRVSGAAASGLMMTLHSLMSPRRKRQIETALAKWCKQQTWSGYKNRCPRGHEYNVVRITKRGNRRLCTICSNARRRKAS